MHTDVLLPSSFRGTDSFLLDRRRDKKARVTKISAAVQHSPSKMKENWVDPDLAVVVLGSSS